ncbi:MAG: hypothetical protein HYU66_23250, partial [Armatimonadetes bacterium]|nr:hypothetical protein [Armatimonadota bacterium]
MPRLLATLCLAASLALAADPGPKLDGWTYLTTAPPLADQYADPGNRLTDGDTSRGKTAIWQAGSVTFELDLGRACKLAAVRVYQFRHNLNYKLDHLAVEARRGGDWVELGRTGGFFGPTPTNDFVHELDLKGAVTDGLRLQFAGVGVLSLSEIELFGTTVSPVAATGAFATVPFRTGGPSAREEDLDGDGKPEVILENAYVRLIFSPAAGGVCRSLRQKVPPDGPELVYSTESGYGLLRDQLWKPDYSFADRFYFSKLENTPQEAAVELWTTGVGGMMSFTAIHKRIALQPDGPAVRVHYRLENEVSSQTDYEYGFWSHNWLGVGGRANTYVYPTTTGVQSFTLDPAKADKGGDLWYREPARGWMAVVSDQGDGVVTLLPYKYVNLYYSWYGSSSPAATHEWRFNLLTVKPGDKLEFDLFLLPFRGLPAVDGEAEGLFGSLTAQAEGDRITAQTRAIQPFGFGRTHMVRWALQTWPDRKPAAPVDDKPLELGPGGLLNSPEEWTGLKPGAYLVRLEVLRANQVVGAIEKPVSVGGGQVAYRVDPEEPQVGRREEAAPKSTFRISTAVESPHVPWAKPFAGGRMKALVLMDDQNSREAVELAERLDIDLDYTKFRTTFDKELLYQGDLGILTLDAAQKAFDLKLKNHYDVIVLCGFNWGFHFSPSNRAAILAQVRDGTGLVLVQPDGFDAAAAAELPVAGVAKSGAAARSFYTLARWAPKGDNPLVQGLDWSRFPVTRRHEYDTPPQGDVIATIGDDNAPLITLGSAGRGRVCSTTWDTLTHDMSYRGYSALTPILSYRGGWLRDDYAGLPVGYHEPWFALLARLVAWAAGRDTGVSLTAAPPVNADAAALPDTAVSLEVTAAKAVPGASLEVHWITPYRGETLVAKQPAPLAAGTQTLKAAAPAGLKAGPSTACLIVRDASGGALAWGFTTVNLTTPVSIAGLSVTPPDVLPAGGVWQEDGAVETQAFRPEKPLE